MNKSDFNTMT